MHSPGLRARLARVRRRFCLPYTMVELGGLDVKYDISIFRTETPHTTPHAQTPALPSRSVAGVKIGGLDYSSHTKAIADRDSARVKGGVTGLFPRI